MPSFIYVKIVNVGRKDPRRMVGRFEITIDLEKLADKMAYRAANNRSRMASFVDGGVVFKTISLVDTGEQP